MSCTFVSYFLGSICTTVHDFREWDVVVIFEKVPLGKTAFFQRSPSKCIKSGGLGPKSHSLGRRPRPIFFRSDRSKRHFSALIWPPNTHPRPISAPPKQTKHFFTPCFSVGKHPSTPTYDLDGSGAAMVERRGPAI